MSRPDRRKPGRLVIVGAGHAHLEVIRRLGRTVAAGHEATVVTPDDFWYSGLATGMLGGQYEVELDRVDVADLASRVGARLVRDEVVAVDVAERTVRTAGGQELPFDVVSLDVGSRVPTERIPGLEAVAFTVKPIGRLAALRADLARRLDRGDDPVRLLVVGGGATAAEVAANARGLAARSAADGRIAVTLAADGDRLLAGFPEGARRCLERHLGRVGVDVRPGAPIVAVEDGAAVTAAGDRLGFDVLVAATGLVPPPLVGRLGLPTDRAGALLVDDCLRSVAAPSVFGGGDCVRVRGRDLPRIGVVAVRQAKVLSHNLRAALEGRRLRRYRPQRRFLLILNLGDGTGLARWGPLWRHGRSMLRWKEHLDAGFLRRYR